MTHNEIIRYCLSKSGAFLDYPLGPGSTIIKVKSKKSAARIFAQVFNLNGIAKATFNCDMMTGEFYRAAYPGAVMRGYHCPPPPIQQPYFNTVDLSSMVLDEEIVHMINHAYKVEIGKLPKKHLEELEVAADEA